MSALKIRRLLESDDVSSFDCGKEVLNDYLKDKAWKAFSVNGTVTWVACEGGRIIGYYSSVFGSMNQESAPRKARGAVHPYDVSFLKIARLGVDRSFQKRGIGPVLVLHALKEAVAASERAGLRMVTVDALEQDVMSFYERFGFKCYDSEDLSMFIVIKDVRKTLGL